MAIDGDDWRLRGFFQGISAIVLVGECAIVSGNPTLAQSTRKASDGQIELESVAGNSRVSLTSTSTGYAFSYGNVGNFQDIPLMQ